MKEIQIGLLWHSFGRPNLGVDALCRSNIQLIKNAAARVGVGAKFVLLSRPGMGDRVNSPQPDVDGVELGDYFRLRQALTLRLGDYRRALKACDIIFDISSGDGFSDIYGRFIFSIQAITKWFALRSGAPLILSPQTLGPYKHSWTRFAAAYIIKNSRATFARDNLSTDVPLELGLGEPAKEMIDVAFALPFSPAFKVDDGKIRVGINISALLQSRGEHFGLTINYPAYINRLLEVLGSMPSVETWLIPHVIHDDDVLVGDDYRVILEYAKRYEFVRVAPRFSNSVEAKSFISGMDVFTGARMHACIAAYSSGVPVIPFAYSRKFNGLFHTLGYTRLIDGLVDNADTALNITMRAIEERSMIAQEIATGLAMAKQRLTQYEILISEFIREAANKHA